ncbi:MAG: hydrogenase maturation nickel metallochaperone HypA [Eggerthellaceae bacterium]|jgi:hydrogenase nickel incorporation protein HypA/HybF
MHEASIIMGVLDVVNKTAEEAHARRVTEVKLSVGEMTEAIPDSLHFAFDALTKGSICEGAHLSLRMVKPESLCLDCGARFTHDRFHMTCPECGSYVLELLHGRELDIDSIEVDIPEDEDTKIDE